jgi:hypothetical protein
MLVPIGSASSAAEVAGGSCASIHAMPTARACSNASRLDANDATCGKWRSSSRSGVTRVITKPEANRLVEIACA